MNRILKNPEPLVLDKAEVKYLPCKKRCRRRKIGNIRYAVRFRCRREHSTPLCLQYCKPKNSRSKPGHHHSGKPGMRRSCGNIVLSMVRNAWSLSLTTALRSTESVQRLPYPEGLPKSSTPDASDESKSDTSENEMDVPF